MDYDLNTTLKQIRHLDTTGNIIPHSWYKAITFENGKPDLLGLMILAEIVYWYRPTEIRDQYTGRLIEYRKKFKGHMLQRNYASFSEQFGISARQAMDAIKRLEQKGFLIKEIRNIRTQTFTLGNVLFLAPNVEKLLSLQGETSIFNLKASSGEGGEISFLEETPHTFERMSSYDQTDKLAQTNVEAYTFEGKTYTENTTQISSDIKKTAADKKISENAAVEFQKKSREENFPAQNVIREKPEAVLELEKRLLKKPLENRFPHSLIGKTLTSLQEEIVHKSAQKLAKMLGHPEVGQLQEEITFSLLCTSSFSQAGNDFFKKLNTISKNIREGRWRRPAQMIEKDEKQSKVVVQISKIKERELENECAHWKYMAGLLEGKNNPEQMRSVIAQHKKAIQELKEFQKTQKTDSVSNQI